MVFNLHDQLSNCARTVATNRCARRSWCTTRRSRARATRCRATSDTSEARQYSGRAVDGEWRCPFHYQGGGNG
ncbi:hypothetical protein AB5I41_18755 [Sphingomonas sp. MMS24-JH45]